MSRAQQLKQLARATHKGLKELEVNEEMTDEQIEDTQWDLITDAVVKGFDILMGEKP